VKRPINHVRNLQYSIAATVLIAFVVSVVNPINGWVFGLITIVIVTLPMTLITVIVHNVQARRSTPESLVKAEPASSPEGEHASQVTEVPLSLLRAKQDFKNRGWIHLSIGLVVLTVAIVNLFIAQTQPLWTRMFTEPFWWIIAACSSVSFVLANSNFFKANELEPKKEEGENNHG
jgi:anaerobic C4-dicarboxylate transporter